MLGTLSLLEFLCYSFHMLMGKEVSGLLVFVFEINFTICSWSINEKIITGYRISWMGSFNIKDFLFFSHK